MWSLLSESTSELGYASRPVDGYCRASDSLLAILDLLTVADRSACDSLTEGRLATHISACDRVGDGLLGGIGAAVGDVTSSVGTTS